MPYALRERVLPTLWVMTCPSGQAEATGRQFKGRWRAEKRRVELLVFHETSHLYFTLTVLRPCTLASGLLLRGFLRLADLRRGKAW